MHLMDGNKIELGVCYYPEHWPESNWENDLQRMLEAGLGTIRIAEFAWNKFEPEEGVFTFDFFDRFLSLCARVGMKVIFCTPTATPPAWLTERYPEVLNSDIDGHTIYHGLRLHCNYTSPTMRAFSRRITEALGAHYAAHPSVVGWQLGNEFNCETNQYYSPADDRAFRAWLIQRYCSLDVLNDAWGTVFWNQTYTTWEQVHLPRKTVNGTINPHLHLDYLRFISFLVCTFAKEQADILRKYIKPGDFITTNGMFGHLDYNQMMKESLDMLTYDSYPNFAYCLDNERQGTEDLGDRTWSRNLTEVRAVSPCFGIREQQGGANGWTTRMEACTPRPGQITLWTMQSIAHGADYVSYFRWRTCTFGTEIYWHGILDYSGRENRRLREVRAVRQLIEKLQDVAGAKYLAKVGVLKDYDNVFHAEVDVWHRRLEKQSGDALFAAMQRTHTPYDVAYFRADLTDDEQLAAFAPYQVLFAPHQCLLTEQQVRVLTRWVENGGKLVLGARTGYMDSNGRCVTANLPGLASELAGVDIPEYSFVPLDEMPSMMDWNGREISTPVFNDLLVPVGDAQVIARYSRGYVAGQAALVRNPVGRGEVWSLGSAFGEDTVRALLDALGASEPFAGQVSLPEDCELAVREKDGVQYFFLLNYQKEARTVKIGSAMHSLLDNQMVEGDVVLPPYGVMVLTTAIPA